MERTYRESGRMDIDWSFGSVIVTLGSLIATLVFRKRIGRAIGRFILAGTPEFIEDVLWEEGEQVIEGKKVRVKTLRKPVAAQLEALAPALVTPILKSIKIKIPENLPINPATGQIDLLAPIASKLMRGGKVNAMDIMAPFVPTLMQVGQAVGGKLQEAVQGYMAKGKPKEAGKMELTPDAQKILEKAMTR